MAPKPTQPSGILESAHGQEYEPLATVLSGIVDTAASASETVLGDFSGAAQWSCARYIVNVHVSPLGRYAVRSSRTSCECAGGVTSSVFS